MLVALGTQCLFSSSLALSRPVVYFTADRSLQIVQIFFGSFIFLQPKMGCGASKAGPCLPFKFPTPVSTLKAKTSFPKFK